MTEDRVRDILRAARDEKAARATDMPDDDAAMLAMHRAYQRLRDLGWADAVYSPKDGMVFEALEAGCVVPGRCHYMGEWPNGDWWMHSDTDIWPSRPILWRKLSKKEIAEPGGQMTGDAEEKMCVTVNNWKEPHA